MKNQGPELGVGVAGSVKTSGRRPLTRATGEGHCHWIMSEGAAEDRLTFATGSGKGRNGNWCDSMQVELSRCLPSQPFCSLHLAHHPLPARSPRPSTPPSILGHDTEVPLCSLIYLGIHPQTY